MRLNVTPPITFAGVLVGRLNDTPSTVNCAVCLELPISVSTVGCDVNLATCRKFEVSPGEPTRM